MFISTNFKPLLVALLLIALFLPGQLRAAGVEESAGVAVGVTAGNAVFLPAKAAALVFGLSAGLFSFVATGGDREVTEQIWQNTIAGPYLITPAVARAGVGERPELEKE